MLNQIRRWGAILALLATGCAGGRSIVPTADLTDPPERDVYYVTTISGEELEFVTLSSDGTQISGTVRTIQSRMVGQGSDERLESRSQYRDVTLPLKEVARVEVSKPKGNTLLLVAAGAAAIGGALLLFQGGDQSSDPGSGTGGREPPPLP